MYFMYHVLYSIACYNPATGCYMIINSFLDALLYESVWYGGSTVRHGSPPSVPRPADRRILSGPRRHL